MKRWFDDAPIRWKLTALMAATTAIALLLTAVALGSYEVLTFRRALEQKLTVVAEIVGRNCTAALAFGDKAGAEDVLAALGAEPSIEAGVVFDKNGRVFATYTRPGQEAPPTVAPRPGTRGERGLLVVVRPVVQDGVTVGTVLVEGITTSGLSTQPACPTLSKRVLTSAREMPLVR